MIFSVIYEVDTSESVDIQDYYPPKDQLEELWTCTESSDGESERSYLGGCWEEGAHRKWCALLTRKQFEEFLSETGLVADDTETMGSLGAPGMGFGCAPAILFDGDEYSAFAHAYVTPIPTVHTMEQFDNPRPTFKGFDERAWERVRRVVIDTYREGCM